jgi:hypothetical protein
MGKPKVTGPPIKWLTRTSISAAQGSRIGFAAAVSRQVRPMPTASLSSNMPATAT